MDEHDQSDDVECKCITCDMRAAIMATLVTHGKAIEVAKPDGSSTCRVIDGNAFFEVLAIVCAETIAHAEDGSDNLDIAEGFYDAIDAYLAALRGEEGAEVHLHPVEDAKDEIADAPAHASATKH